MCELLDREKGPMKVEKITVTRSWWSVQFVQTQHV